MDAARLYEAGRLDEAIEALSVALRDDPGDVRRRTFLFELLCFDGAYERAEKHLDVVASASSEAEMGAWLYRSAIHGEQTRQEMFETETFPVTRPPPPAVCGTLNGDAFDSLTDADPRVGARLEVLAAGEYTWIPFEHIAAIRMEPPKRLRDLLWAPVRVEPVEEMAELELGEVLMPVLAPLSWKSDDPEVKLGRVSDWTDLGDDAFAPIGQKLLLVDGEPFPVLEIRELEISGPRPSGD